jgi:2-keto-4-pentenoate hydratase
MTDAPSFDPAVAARRLAHAWRQDERLNDIPSAERPQSIEEGYAVQGRLAHEWGEPVIGYKLGLSSPNAMHASGLSRPITGFIPRSRMYASGATLPLRQSDEILMEVEIAFELAREIQPGEPIDHLAEIVRSASLSLEVVRSHFVDRTRVALPSFVADNSGFHAFIRGQTVELDQVANIGATEVRLFRDGVEASVTAPVEDRPDPFAALRTFLIMASERGQVLAESLIISTGNLVLPHQTQSAGRYHASLDQATVEVSIKAIPEL